MSQTKDRELPRTLDRVFERIEGLLESLEEE